MKRAVGSFSRRVTIPRATGVKSRGETTSKRGHRIFRNLVRTGSPLSSSLSSLRSRYVVVSSATILSRSCDGDSVPILTGGGSRV